MPHIVRFTQAARLHIQRFLSPLGKGAGIRLGVQKSGCSGYAYCVDTKLGPQPEDICFEEAGLRVFIDAPSIPMLKGTVIDVVEKVLHQKQLQFDNPNAIASCGCGESFTLKTEPTHKDT